MAAGSVGRDVPIGAEARRSRASGGDGLLGRPSRSRRRWAHPRRLWLRAEDARGRGQDVDDGLAGLDLGDGPARSTVPLGHLPGDERRRFVVDVLAGDEDRCGLAHDPQSSRTAATTWPGRAGPAFSSGPHDGIGCSGDASRRSRRRAPGRARRSGPRPRPRRRRIPALPRRSGAGRSARPTRRSAGGRAGRAASGRSPRRRSRASSNSGSSAFSTSASIPP